MAKVNKLIEPSYQQLSDELNEVLSALQQDDVDIDAVMDYYKRGLELVKQLKQYLETAENNVEKLKAKYGDAS